MNHFRTRFNSKSKIGKPILPGKFEDEFGFAFSGSLFRKACGSNSLTMLSNLPDESDRQFPPNFASDLIQLFKVGHKMANKLTHQDRIELLEALQDVERWPINFHGNQ